MSNSVRADKKQGAIKSIFWTVENGNKEKSNENNEEMNKIIIEMPEEKQESIKAMLSRVKALEGKMIIPEIWKKSEKTIIVRRDQKITGATIKIKEEMQEEKIQDQEREF